MFKKEVILSNFVKRNKILSYLEFIHNKYGINYDSIFVYTIDGNDNEYLATFKIDANNKEIIKEIKGGCIMHFKKGCLFTINALNKLTLQDLDENKDKFIEINWELYTNKLILTNDDKVSVKDISKIEDKAYFFK